jgi:hypothetical protein
MAILEVIFSTVQEWATRHKDALPEWPTVIAEGALGDGTLVAVGYHPPIITDQSPEDHPKIVYRLQRDSVWAATPMTVQSACDGAAVEFIHRSTERHLERMRRQHA